MTEIISPQTDVARGATFIFIQGFLNAALGVLYVWLLLHTQEITGQVLFAESDFGVFTMMGFILTLASTLGVLALRAASVRFVAHYLAEGKRDEAKSVMSRVLQVSAITSLTIMVLLLVLAGTLSNIFASNVPNSVLIFQLLPIAAVFQIFYFQALAFLQGMQKLRVFAFLGIFYTVVNYSVATLLVYAGFGVLGIVIGWLFATALSCSVALSATFRYIGFSPHVHNLKPLLGFSFPLYFSGLFTFVVSWIDQIFVFPFLGVEALGVYNLAVRASMVPLLVSGAIVTSIFPKLTELYSKLGVKSLRDAFKVSTRYAAFLGFPVSLIVATLAYPIIVLFATVRFVDAVLPLAVMCIAALPVTLGSAIAPTLLTLRKTKMASLITGISILLKVSLSYVALTILNMHLTGVALSRFFAALVQLILGVYILRLSLKIEFDKEAVWKSTVASIVMVLSLFALELLRAIIEPSSYQLLVLRLRHLPIYACVGLIVYLCSLVALKAVKKRDIELLRDYLPSKLHWIAELCGRVARA